MKDKLFEVAVHNSIVLLRNFCTKLNLDPSILDCLYDVDVKIANVPGDENAVYYPHTNAIHYNIDYLNDLCKMISEDSSKTQLVLYNIEQDLLHEFLHASRNRISKDSSSFKIDGCEEIFTDVIADIVIMSFKDDNINLSRITSSIASDTNHDIDYRLGARIVNLMGIDMIRSFISNDISVDYFKNLFCDDTDKLGNLLNQLYSVCSCGEKVSMRLINEISSIISKVR